MDQQTVQQLITAGAAIVATLLGASLTAFIHSRTTAKMLASSEKQIDRQWTETRRIERDQWERDQKTEAYSRFIRSASPFHVSNLMAESKADSIAAQESQITFTLSNVMVFGSAAVVASAISYRNEVVSISADYANVQEDIIRPFRGRLNALSPEELEEVSATAMQKASDITAARLDELVSSFQDLVDLMRQDCGMEIMGVSMKVSD